MLVGHEVYYAVRAFGVKFGRVSVFIAEHVARKLDNRRLHAEADAEIGNIVFARVFCTDYLALYAAVAEAAGHKNAVYSA